MTDTITVTIPRVLTEEHFKKLDKLAGTPKYKQRIDSIDREDPKFDTRMTQIFVDVLLEAVRID